MTPRFGDTHPVELVRGLKHPSPARIRRAMLQRVKYLSEKIESMARCGHTLVKAGHHPMLTELTSILVLTAQFDAMHPRIDDTDDPSLASGKPPV